MASKTKITAASKVRTKGSIYKDIAGLTGLTRKQVVAVFDSMTEMMKADLSKKGCGTFNLFGLAKMHTVIKPATKARKGINPFTKQEVMFKAKPARNVIKIRALKTLKGRLNLARLYPKAPKLDLIVRPAPKLQNTVRTPTTKITRPVHPRTGRSKWTRNKTLGR